MEPAGHVGAGDQGEHGVVVAELPGPEALAQVGVEVDGHHDRKPRWQAGDVTRRRDEVLITATELARLLAADEPVTILDVRWQLTEPDGRDAYERGHIPGAVYVSLEDELSDHTVAGRGRHPLPSGHAVETAARRWGIRMGQLVVVYDDWNRAGSARAWWVLTAAGIENVRILDGGLAAWTGRRLRRDGTVAPEPGDVTVPHEDLYAGALPTLTAGAGDGRRYPARRAGTRAISSAMSSRSIRSQDTFQEPATCRAPAYLAGRRNVSGRRRISRGCSAISTNARRLLRVRRHRVGGRRRARYGRHRRCAVSRVVVRMVFGPYASR